MSDLSDFVNMDFATDAPGLPTRAEPVEKDQTVVRDRQPRDHQMQVGTDRTIRAQGRSDQPLSQDSRQPIHWTNLAPSWVSRENVEQIPRLPQPAPGMGWRIGGLPSVTAVPR